MVQLSAFFSADLFSYETPLKWRSTNGRNKSLAKNWFALKTRKSESYFEPKFLLKLTFNWLFISNKVKFFPVLLSSLHYPSMAGALLFYSQLYLGLLSLLLLHHNYSTAGWVFLADDITINSFVCVDSRSRVYGM